MIGDDETALGALDDQRLALTVAVQVLPHRFPTVVPNRETRPPRARWHAATRKEPSEYVTGIKWYQYL